MSGCSSVALAFLALLGAAVLLHTRPACAVVLQHQQQTPPHADAGSAAAAAAATCRAKYAADFGPLVDRYLSPWSKSGISAQLMADTIHGYAVPVKGQALGRGFAFAFINGEAAAGRGGALQQGCCVCIAGSARMQG